MNIPSEHRKNQSSDAINYRDNINELDFSDEEPPSFQDLTPDSEAVQSQIETSPLVNRPNNSNEPTNDDLAPEILIREDGALSPQEVGSDKAADQTLTVVDLDEIGGGDGLDEAELAEIDPVMKKPTGN